MSKSIIGIDPDSNKSGFARYFDGRLVDIDCLGLITIYNVLKSEKNRCKHLGVTLEIHIENVNGISSNAFSVNKKDSLPVKLKKAEHVGKCKQAQIEIERIANRLNIKVVRHRVSKMWKDSKIGKAALADLGWHGQSNEDSRSAAYFGYLGLTQSK